MRRLHFTAFLPRFAALSAVFLVTLTLQFSSADAYEGVAKPSDSRSTRPEVVLQTGHTRSLQSAIFSPDGRHILTTSNGTAILWDADSGNRLRTMKGSPYGGAPAFFSPGGRWIITWRFGDAVVIRDATTGKKIHRLEAHNISVSFSPDGRQIITGSGDKTARIWDVATGRKLRSLVGHSGIVRSATFSADGSRIVTASDDKTAVVWDAHTGRRIRTLRGHTGWVVAAEFSPNSQRIVTASLGKEAIVWDATTGAKLRTLRANTFIFSPTFSPDGRKILTRGSKVAMLWDTATGNRVRTFNGNIGNLESVSFSPDGRKVVTTYRNGTAILWDVATTNRIHTLNGHEKTVSSASFSPDGQRVVTASYDNTAVVWNAKTGDDILTLKSRTAPVWSTSFSPDGRWILSAQGSVVTVWDGTKGVRLHTLAGHTDTVTCALFSRDARRIATTSKDKSVIVWDANTGEKLQTLTESNPCYFASFAPDGRSIVTTANTATVWDLSTGNKVRILRGHTSVVVSAVYSPDGNQIVTASWDGKAIVWDAMNGRKLRTFTVLRPREKAQTMRAAFCPNGKQIITTSTDSAKSVIVWDVKTGAQLRVLGGIEGGYLHSPAFSSDGRMLVTGSKNYKKTSAIVWDVMTGRKLQTLTGTAGTLSSPKFSPDGKRVVTASKDGTTRLWDVATGEELCSLISIDNGKDWLVVTPEGHFDGSEGGMKKVMFRVGNGLNVVPVERFFQDFYEPGLLARIMRGEKLTPKSDFAKDLPPTIKITSPESGGDVGTRTVNVTVEVKGQGGGIRSVVLRQNGAKVKDVQPTAGAKTFRHTFTLNLVEGENRIRIESACGDGSFESEPVRITFHYNKSLPKPNLYVLAVGINGYAENSLKLSYAAPDAAAIAKLFAERGKTLYESVHITQLLDDKATKRGIRSALQSIAEKAREQDTLVVFLSGHGFRVGQRYFFIPHEFKQQSRRFEDDVVDYGFPSDQIGKHMGEVKALKQILVLDTCNSGAAIGKSHLKHRNPFAFAGAIRRLSRTQGIFTIAASTENEDTVEIRQLGHGALTYSLLTGLKALPTPKHADGNNDGVVTVLEWFTHAADEVPKITKQHLGTAQDVKTAGEGAAFPVLPLQKR